MSKALGVYEASKKLVSQYPEAAEILLDPNADADDKQYALQALHSLIMIETGLDPATVNIVVAALDKGFTSDETKEIYISEDNHKTHADLARTDIHETSRAMDLQENGNYESQSETYKINRTEYASNYGELGENLLNYVLTSQGYSSLESITSNHIGSNIFKPNELTQNVKTASITYNSLDKALGSNRRLSQEEMSYINYVSEDYAQKRGISTEQAQKELTTAALYNIDKTARNQFDKGTALLKASNLEMNENIFDLQARENSIKEAYNYLIETSKDEYSLIDMYKEQLTTQAMFTSTDEQFNNPYWDINNAIGLQDVTLDTLLLFTPLKVGGKVEGSVGKIVSNKDIGVKWVGGNPQGTPFEMFVGTTLPVDAKLPVNFKTFDYFDGSVGKAISVKTLDTLTPAKVANPDQIYSSLKKNIDDMIDFTGHRLSDRRITPNMIKTKELQVGIPYGTTKEGLEQIKRAIDYAKINNINVVITVIK
jgi:hypothetical protein